MYNVEENIKDNYGRMTGSRKRWTRVDLGVEREKATPDNPGENLQFYQTKNK